MAKVDSQCRGADHDYDGFTVKDIRVGPLLKFIPVGSELKDALAEAISKQSPGSPSLRVNEPFSPGGVSFLEAALGQELEKRQLKGKTGLIYPRHRLVNCDPSLRTLEVEYRILTIARPSYPKVNFELHDRKDKEEEEAVQNEEDKSKMAARPFVGYNRSRGIYAGTALSFQTGVKPVSKFDVNVSGSGSSAVAEASFAGTREYSSGPFSYAEWRFGYRYSNIPTDTIRLKESTVLGQFFSATRPLNFHQLFLRFGASLEGGNRQTNLAQGSVPATNAARSGYGAAKMYVGASFTGNRQDWKISYGLQLGNDGEDLSVDFSKQIFDAAYRARFLPRDYMPLQIDAQLTAGSLYRFSGEVPVGERFFGGNVEREFIQGDTWRIRSNPVIRSIPENRLNRIGAGLPIGGENFVSINLTVAPTVWQRQLMPKEIANSPDVNAGLGGQLLSTRLYLREEAIQKSKQIKNLESQIGCQRSECLTTVVNRLKTELRNLQAGHIPDQISQSIGKFFDDTDAGGKPIPDIEDAIAAAKLDPEALKKPLEDVAALAAIQNNPVEGNAVLLTKDDPGDPADPDDDTTSLITTLRAHIVKLQQDLAAIDMAERGRALDQIKTDLESARGAIQDGIASVNSLRSYAPNEIAPALRSLNEPSSSGRKMDQILADIRQQLKPLRDNTKQELEDQKRELDRLRADSPEAEAIREKRSTLIEFQDLLDATDTYAEKASDAFDSANDPANVKQLYLTKNDLERLTVGFGGLVAYITGLAGSVNDLQKPLAERGKTPLWNTLRTDADELLLIQKKVRNDYRKIRVPAAEVRANQTVSYVGRVLGVFFRELNLVAVSPVFMFDAARLGPRSATAQGGFRYGVGSGIRFSLVNLDLTAGYSLNPNRRPGEGRGAFVFAMNINDLFH